VSKWQTDTESKVAQFWGEIMSIGDLNRDDGFLDLGGDSIMAVRFNVRVLNEFDVDIPIETALSNTTVPQMASLIDSLRSRPPLATGDAPVARSATATQEQGSD
jgi:acyl carrier protein